MQLNTIEEIIEDIRQGKMVVLMDDEDRENEGDLVMAAVHVRPEDINFMAKHARGLICLTLTEERCRQLDLPLMVRNNNAQHGTNFTMSIEAAEGVTTGISAADRALTVRTAVARDARPTDIVQPGHIFPLMAQPGGVLYRAGHTEAGCDLARLAGVEPAAVIVEIMNEDGTMARRPDLEKFAKEHGLKIGTIADLIQYRMFKEKTIERKMEHEIETAHGRFNLVAYQDAIGDAVHLALVKGDIRADQVTTVRVQTLDVLRDVIEAVKDGHVGWSMHNVLETLAGCDAGVAVLIGQDFNAGNLLGVLESYFAGTRRAEAVSGESGSVYRTVGTGSQILHDLGVGKMRLMSSPVKYNALSGFELEIVEFIESEK